MERLLYVFAAPGFAIGSFIRSNASCTWNAIDTYKDHDYYKNDVPSHGWWVIWKKANVNYKVIVLQKPYY